MIFVGGSFDCFCFDFLGDRYLSPNKSKILFLISLWKWILVPPIVKGFHFLIFLLLIRKDYLIRLSQTSFFVQIC